MTILQFQRIENQFSYKLYDNSFSYLFLTILQQGLQDFLPQLVDQMASTSLASDLKPATITYDVITEEDVEKVLKLLKNTFFKARNNSRVAAASLERCFIFPGLLFQILNALSKQFYIGKH